MLLRRVMGRGGGGGAVAYKWLIQTVYFDEA